MRLAKMMEKGREGERTVRRGMHEDYGKGYQVRGEEEAGG